MKTLLPPAVCGLLAVGCMGLNTRPTPPTPAPQLYDTVPTAQELVAHLNRTTAKVTSLESRDLDIEVVANGRSLPSCSGDLFCAKPRNFRLRAKKPVVGGPAADFGSNDKEFWFWTLDDKDMYHCAYTDVSQGNVRLPFPLHPDWVLEALGMAAPAPVGTPEEEQARGRSLEVKKTPDNKHIVLYERTTSMQGQPVTKATMLNNFAAKGTTPQVVGYYLYDNRDPKQPICQAMVTKVQFDAASGAMVPQRVELKWPSMNLTMALTLDKIAVNNPQLASNAKLFARPHYPNIRDVDLARAAPVMQPTNIQRAGAFR